jgi:hypothetical protein
MRDLDLAPRASWSSRRKPRPADRRALGTFVQAHSMVGLITSAIRLSLPSDEAF